MSRVDVRKTYKLYVGGAFPRSESGRTFEVTDSSGAFLANAARASRKDARDAVVAARKAFAGWATRTPYNRGQIMYRIAEVAEGRRDQLTDEVASAEGLSRSAAGKVVDAAVDRWVWYAGWADKFAQVAGNANAVSAPYFNLSSPEPTGIVAIAAPQDSSLFGLTSVLAPVIVTGNTVVLVTSASRPLPAVTLSEVLATSDLPGGVVNILTGDVAEIGPWLASHLDVNAIDLTGAAGLTEQATAFEEAAAENLKRVLRPPITEPDWHVQPGIDRMTTFLETKTVWHPIGI